MALPATDAFTGTTNDQLTTYSSNWTLTEGDFDIQSNQIAPDFGGECSAHWNADVFNDDQYSKITLSAVAAAAYIGVTVRATSSPVNHYGVYYKDGTAFSFEVNSGTWTQKATGSFGALNDIVEIRASGTSIDVYENDTINSTLSFTDATHTSGSAGLSGYGDAITTLGDDWEGGNLGAAGATSLLLPRNALQGLIQR